MLFGERVTHLNFGAPVGKTPCGALLQFVYVIVCGCLRTQIAAVFVGLKIRRVQANARIIVRLGSLEVAEKSAHAGAVVQKPRIARLRGKRSTVGGLGASLLVAKAVDAPRGVADGSRRRRQLFCAMCRSEGLVTSPEG